MSREPLELLDGPWTSRAAAERRRKEIASSRPDNRAPSIVRVDEDGTTIIREEPA